MKKVTYLFILGTVAFFGCSEVKENAETTCTEAIDEVVSEVEEIVFEQMPVTSQGIQQGELPEEIEFEGQFAGCIFWNDANGSNYFVQTRIDPYFEKSEYTMHFQSADLMAYHYVGNEKNEYRLVRKLTDFVKDCEFDIKCEFLEDIVLTDDDSDNEFEVTFGYQLACRSDVSPSEMKVVMFEAGDKYILRGTSVALGDGGGYEAGEELKNAPNSFLTILKTFWDAHKVEYEENNFYE